MTPTPETLRKKLKEIEKKIQEAEAQLPAHSVKPPLMQVIFELEEERNRILDALKTLEKPPPQS